MTKKLLLARSDHDIGNHYLFMYSQEIVTEAEARGWSVERADNDRNTRKSVHSRLSNKPNLVVLNGHGSDDEVYGFKDEVVLGPYDSALLSGCVAFIRACASLNGLGVRAVKSGAKAVAGYRGDFWIPRIHEYHATPLKDPSARPVLEASNLVPLRLLKGASVQSAVEASKKYSFELISRMLTSGEPYDSPSVRALINNQALLGFEGEPTSSV